MPLEDKMASGSPLPRPLPRLSFMFFGPQFGGFWIPTWWILEPNFVDFHYQLGGFSSKYPLHLLVRLLG